MERPDFFTLKNGDKAKLPFTNQEYQKRLTNLRIETFNWKERNLFLSKKN